MSQTTASNPLRLAVDQHDELDPLVFERRQSTRRRMRGQVTALIRSAAESPKEARQHKICAMTLHDMSDTGIGMMAQEPIALGDEVTVFFPPHGSERGFDINGTVVRQNQANDQTSIGIRYGSQIMAA
ncbi:PilZ domain-containing protein [Mucisphaera calidilacus]|uniref:PilZ domain protein n=1 Tax=Mucisphaera calidilacus TaxID=2527982 RepID=A0A518BX72_9BACT|nr:PilZ domain-containing protein [Mucisphaera calidilacus]QDU71566.1 PilZ domain protein [Mucisphaera calidilacus]